MQSSYYSSASAMLTQFNRLDTLANNLANINTAGFKEDNLIVGAFSRIFKNAQDELSLQNHTKEAANYLNRALDKAPQVIDSYTDFSLGDMQNSTNPLDMAISKEGLFFLVKTPNGLRLTRDGTFTKRDDGALVTKDGFEVLPNDYFASLQNIQLNPQDSSIVVDKDGTISTGSGDNAEFGANAKLFIAKPDNLRLLKKDSNNLYTYPDIENIDRDDNSGSLMQGFVEKSNVNAVKTMTYVIEANRLVQMYQKAMDSTMNDMNRDAIEKISKKA